MTDAAQTASTETTGPFTPDIISEVFGEDAAQAQAAEAKATPAPEGDGKPKEKGVADRIAAAMKAEKKAAELRAENERKEKEVSARESTLTTRESEAALFEEDPAGFIAKKGWDEKRVASFLDKLAGTYKPEAVADKKLTTLEQELADVKAKLDAKEKAETDAKKTVEQRQVEREAGKAFVEHIVSDADKYPHLTEVYANDDEVIAAGFAVLHEPVLHVQTGRPILNEDGKPISRLQAFIAHHGRGPSNEELADHLDSVAKAKIEARTNASWRKGNAANQAGQAASGESKEVPPVKGTSPRTLSRADTSTRAAAPRKQEWSQEQADEQSLAILQKAMKR